MSMHRRRPSIRNGANDAQAAFETETPETLRAQLERLRQVTLGLDYYAGTDLSNVSRRDLISKASDILSKLLLSLKSSRDDASICCKGAVEAYAAAVAHLQSSIWSLDAVSSKVAHADRVLELCHGSPDV